MPILESALEYVGATPLIRCSRLAQQEGIACNILAKCEFYNAGGSAKDRVAAHMIEDAEKKGLLTPGYSTIIEPTSGNTGIGLALVAAIKGYRCIICMPSSMSMEKEVLMKSLGAELIRTPCVGWDHPDSLFSVAKRLQQEIPGAVILDQFNNCKNPEVHYNATAVEIINDIQTSAPDMNKQRLSAPTSPFTPPATPPPSQLCDLICAGAGTGGTISGIGKRMREHNPNCVVLAVDPVGSAFARPESLNPVNGEVPRGYTVEGIGFHPGFDPKDNTKLANIAPPSTCHQEVITQWQKVRDEEGFEMARRMMRVEGLLCGGSSGAAMAGLIRFLKEDPKGIALAENPDANVVVVLADGVRNYMSKPWMSQAPTDPHVVNCASKVAP